MRFTLVLLGTVIGSCGAGGAKTIEGSSAPEARSESVEVSRHGDAISPASIGSLMSFACTDSASPTAAKRGNENQWAAVTLNPPQYPYTITGAKYYIVEGGPCHGTTTAHQLQFYVSDGANPSATPAAVATINVPAGGGNGVTLTPVQSSVQSQSNILVHESLEGDVTLETPITLSAGQTLVAAVQMASGICVVGCEGGAAAHNWWSNGSAPPFTWAPLSSFGNKTALAIGAIGHP